MNHIVIMAETRNAAQAITNAGEALTLICPTRGCGNIQQIWNTTLYNGKTWCKIRCKHCGANYSSCKWQCQCGCTWAACTTHRGIGMAMKNDHPANRHIAHKKQVGRQPHAVSNRRAKKTHTRGIATHMLDITDADKGSQPESWAVPLPEESLCDNTAGFQYAF